MVLANTLSGTHCGRARERKGKTTPCRARASYRVGIALSPGPKTPHQDPVVVWLPQTVCAGCRSALTFREAMPARAWMEMRDAIKARHGFSLRRRLAKLTFKRI